MRLLFLSLILALVCAASHAQKAAPSAAALVSAIDKGELAWELSEPAEVQALFGAPAQQSTRRSGGLEVLTWTYAPDFAVFFNHQFNSQMPYVLARASDGKQEFGRREGTKLVLRTTADLAKLRPFTGFENVDLSKLDLRNEDARVRDMPFDSGTVWPPADRLPKGFDPAAIMRDGLNPGLGVRGLHAQGIDGRSVRIGIIDQPLVRDHVETADRLTVVAEPGVANWPPQMHGPGVTSLAAGKTCGVAPGAKIAYVSMAMWKSGESNEVFFEPLKRLLQLNREARSPSERIRVISISAGMFRKVPLVDEWQALLDQAESEGVLVITCDPVQTRLSFGLLKPLPGGDRDTSDGYTKGSVDAQLLVPGDGRTHAHHEGPTDYAYEPTGGLSWAAPYLAGLSALGFQVNPSLTPARVRAYLVRSATKMPYGTVVNPPAFVKMCREDPDGVTKTKG